MILLQALRNVHFSLLQQAENFINILLYLDFGQRAFEKELAIAPKKLVIVA